MNALNAQGANDVWQVLTIDALESVNDMTEKSLVLTYFLGKTLRVLKASSIQDAKRILEENADIAVILLDTVANTPDESLAFIHFVRTVRKNDRTRIILRTGYPDTLPEINLIHSYEIDGYIPKETMSAAQIEIATLTAMRAYHQIISTRQVLQALAGSIAHEMRNPLSQIQYSLDSIGHVFPVATTASIAQTIPPQKMRELYQHLAQGQLAITRGLQVISMALDEVNAKAIDPANFAYLSAAESTQKALHEYGYETEAERHKASLIVLKDFTFKGDETLYLFILFNLIKNALYYFKHLPDATLTITIDQSTVTVKDTGPGIPPATLSCLFEAFHTSGKTGGTGLGLAYCQRAMQAFGGQIVCHSIVGEYTEFALRFPVVSQAELDTHQQTILAQAAAIFKDKRILIVDDDAPLRMATRQMLEKLGAHTDEVENGQRALLQLGQAQYDLIIMDLNMPVLDGYATTEQIRAGIVPGHQCVPIVAYTSESFYMASANTKKVGMNGFISKPCSRLEFIQTLLQACEQAAQSDNTMTPTLLMGKTVLLADDDRYNRKVVRAYLEQRAIHVIEAEHGHAVLDQLAAHPHCDALVLDINMPGLNGLETARTIRARASSHQQMPIIALTGYSNDTNIQAALTAGINDFITKPVEVPDLYEKLGRQLFSAHPAQDAAQGTTVHSLTTAPLLNIKRLDELRSMGILDDYLSDYLSLIDPLLERLDTSRANHNFEELHQALHSLLGVSGNIGGAALHALIKRHYIPVENGQWPEQANWLAQIKVLTTETVQALQTNYMTSA